MQKSKIPRAKVEIGSVDSEVVSHHKNNMAGGLGDSNSLLIECLKDNAKKGSEIEDYQLAATWAKEKGHNGNIESYETGELNNILEQFYATVGTQGGKECKPDRLRVMATAIDRHVKDREKQTFHTNRQTIFRMKTSP